MSAAFLVMAAPDSAQKLRRWSPARLGNRGGNAVHGVRLAGSLSSGGLQQRQNGPTRSDALLRENGVQKYCRLLTGFDDAALSQCSYAIGGGVSCGLRGGKDFGLPPLEAMRCGCPVVSSSAPVHAGSFGKRRSALLSTLTITARPCRETGALMLTDRLRNGRHAARKAGE